MAYIRCKKTKQDWRVTQLIRARVRNRSKKKTESRQASIVNNRKKETTRESRWSAGIGGIMSNNTRGRNPKKGGEGKASSCETVSKIYLPDSKFFKEKCIPGRKKGGQQRERASHSFLEWVLPWGVQKQTQ